MREISPKSKVPPAPDFGAASQSPKSGLVSSQWLVVSSKTTLIRDHRLRTAGLALDFGLWALDLHPLSEALLAGYLQGRSIFDKVFDKVTDKVADRVLSSGRHPSPLCLLPSPLR